MSRKGHLAPPLGEYQEGFGYSGEGVAVTPAVTPVDFQDACKVRKDVPGLRPQSQEQVRRGGDAVLPRRVLG